MSSAQVRFKPPGGDTSRNAASVADDTAVPAFGFRMAVAT